MKFKVVSSNINTKDLPNEDAQERILAMVNENPIFLFMKGTPEAPQCGFSYRVCDVLRGWKAPFHSFNVLADSEIRQGIKNYSNWPTIPQLYVNQEFIGGCDIIEELSHSGELQEVLGNAYPEQTFVPPPPTSSSAAYFSARGCKLVTGKI